ncbi:MAG: hypothetical protein HXX12_00035 [Geothrix sp.]|uniref:hypothetical protein n=1 Tax=Geothrix sp. TaxID=1962974 RepID=UPI00182C6DE1|nr:hypothetical protein [Geothrix sp.]NWJ39343.1 hypothetical protein [Geothrix sp.]WIL19431.1 MAG: hypothetical protein QOZ81_001948 [Geothrix sp.]
MRLTPLALLATLCSAPLVAEDAPRAKVQLFGERTSFNKSPVLFVVEGGQTYTTEDQPKDQTSWGLRLSLGIDEAATWNVELAVRAKKKSALTYSGPVSPTLTADFTQEGFEYGWWGPGVSYALKLGPAVALSAGLDLRVERLTAFMPAGVVVAEGYSETTIYDRPWARAALTFTLPVSARIKPQVGVEGSVALIRKKVKTYSTTQYVDAEDMRRGLAPQSAFSFFAGVTF